MTLSLKAFAALADTLAPTVAERLFASSAWTEFLHDAIPPLIDDEIGECDEDMLYDLSIVIIDKMKLTVYD